MTRTGYSTARLDLGAATFGFRQLTFSLYRPYLEGHAGRSIEVVAIGARRGLQPVGLVVAEREGPARARLVSILVKPRHRRRGVGRLLLERLADEIDGTIVAGAPSFDTGVDRLLDDTGFGTAEPVAQCWELRAHNLDRIFSRRRRWLPKSLRAAPWTELSAEQRDAALQLEHPRSLSPFRHEAHVEPTTSLALFASDELAGWAIGHRANTDAVHYASIFVREDLRNVGAGAGLFMESLRRHCTHDATRDLAGRFLVRRESERMTQLVERRFTPLATYRSTYLERRQGNRP